MIATFPPLLEKWRPRHGLFIPLFTTLQAYMYIFVTHLEVSHITTKTNNDTQHRR